MLCVSSLSCVTRTLKINTDPPDATIYLDGVEIGTSPVEKKFEYFGTREIIAEKDGYLREVMHVPIEGAWYESFPLDFFTEFLPLYPRTDIRTVNMRLRLSPRNLPRNAEEDPTAVNADSVLERAEKMRQWVPGNKPNPNKP